jgi:hypothetical protein
MKKLLLILLVLAMALFATSVHANSGFPARDYPFNQYGYDSTYYNGPWGERMVYGSYGYFPNFYGQYPYGYRTYGYMYTPNDLRYGNTGMGSYVSYGRSSRAY